MSSKKRISVALIILFFVLVADSVCAQGLSRENLQRIKQSTVYIKSRFGSGFTTGSGFLAARKGGVGYIVTNAHVVSQSFETLGEILVNEADELHVVFSSGESTEKEFKAKIVDRDLENDLALLQIEAEELPSPLKYASVIPAYETQELFVIGFPFGRLLSLSGKNPEVSIGKCAVSSLRKDERGLLAAIQVDGHINPGNSGGPLTNQKGEVVGVAVAKLRGAEIGLAIPGEKIEDLMSGRIGNIVCRRIADKNGLIGYEVVGQMSDPFGKTGAIAVLACPVGLDPKRLDLKNEQWPRFQRDMRAFPLKRESDGRFHGEIYVPGSDEQALIVMQPTFVREGKTHFAEPAFASRQKQSVEFKVSSGWAPLDRTFHIYQVVTAKGRVLPLDSSLLTDEVRQALVELDAAKDLEPVPKEIKGTIFMIADDAAHLKINGRPGHSVAYGSHYAQNDTIRVGDVITIIVENKTGDKGVRMGFRSLDWKYGFCTNGLGTWKQYSPKDLSKDREFIPSRDDQPAILSNVAVFKNQAIQGLGAQAIRGSASGSGNNYLYHVVTEQDLQPLVEYKYPKISRSGGKVKTILHCNADGCFSIAINGVPNFDGSVNSQKFEKELQAGDVICARCTDQGATSGFACIAQTEDGKPMFMSNRATWFMYRPSSIESWWKFDPTAGWPVARSGAAQNLKILTRKELLNGTPPSAISIWGNPFRTRYSTVHLFHVVTEEDLKPK